MLIKTQTVILKKQGQEIYIEHLTLNENRPAIVCKLSNDEMLSCYQVAYQRWFQKNYTKLAPTTVHMYSLTPQISLILDKILKQVNSSILKKMGGRRVFLIRSCFLYHLQVFWEVFTTLIKFSFVCLASSFSEV